MQDLKADRSWKKARTQGLLRIIEEAKGRKPRNMFRQESPCDPAARGKGKHRGHNGNSTASGKRETRVRRAEGEKFQGQCQQKDPGRAKIEDLELKRGRGKMRGSHRHEDSHHEGKWKDSTSIKLFKLAGSKK